MKVLSQDKDEVLVKANIIASTNKAFCIHNVDEEECWIAFSQVEVIDMDTPMTEIEVVIPMWIAENKGLI